MNEQTLQITNEIYQELKNKITCFQQENNLSDLNETSLELEIPFSTLNRFMNDCGNPSFETISKIFKKIGHEEFFLQYINKINPQFLDIVDKFNQQINEAVFLEENISKLFTMKEYFFILAHAYTNNGCLRKDILNKYGEYGLERLEELLLKNVLVEREDRILGNFTKVSMKQQDAQKIFQHSLEYSYDPNLIGKRANWLTFQTESVDKIKAIPAIRTILGYAFNEIKTILYGDEFKGEDKVFVGLLADEFRSIDLEAIKYEEKIITAKLAHKLAHDINSPLTIIENIALNNDIDSGSILDTNIVQGALERIKSMTKELLHTHRQLMRKDSDSNLKTTEVSEQVTTKSFDNENISNRNIFNLVTILEEVLKEKEIQYNELIKKNNILVINLFKNFHGDSLFIYCDQMELKNIFSNLINNSIEAINITSSTNNSSNLSKWINITLMDGTNNIVIQLEDNGKGIPAEVLQKLGTKGFTYGKENGNGLGIYYAKKNITSWGGDIFYQSTKSTNENNSCSCKSGTKITIIFPKVEHNPVKINNQKLQSNKYILIDDDNLVRLHWTNEAHKKNIFLECFQNFKDFFLKIDSFPKDTIICVDYNLENEDSDKDSDEDSSEDGIQIAKKIFDNGFKEIYLCTAHDTSTFNSKVYWIKKVQGKNPPWT
ncbi:MAG: HAMP domain-containing histidine kinase [Oligoflexia bacterium]|nr:HAMP domain-containing histidine kinase [Oligoflexia bacterium]